jgi:hypothetical protein
MEQATNETATVEVTDITPEATAAPALPTREEVKAKGWSKAEMDSAEKRGLIAKTGEKKPEPKAEDKPADFPPAQTEAKAPVKPTSTLPDLEFKTPEQEKAWLDAFGPGTPQRGLYFRMKNERQARQNAEAKAKDLEARLAAVEAAKPAPAPLVDEMGQVIDPDSQPFTLKAWKQMQAEQAAEYQRQQEEQANRHRVISEAHVAQEEYARSVYADFDPTVNLAKEVIQNLDSLVSDVNDREDVKDLIAKMQVAAAQADRIGLDERHAAMIAYRIGKFHPDYGQAPKQTGSKDPKANGGLTAEQMKRIEANTQRRASSASVPAGGGKRTISAEDMDLKTLTGMDYKSRSEFAKDHPKLYAKLLRG